MKNTINYYYNLKIDNISKKNSNYYFYIKNQEYFFIKNNRPIEELNSLYMLNIEMKKRNIIINQIILNKDNQVCTIINNISYVLLKINYYNSNILSLKDIYYMQNITYNISNDKRLCRNDWIKLWCDKIDYYEYQINQFGKDYPILCDSLSYYIGLGENAISYLVNNIDNNLKEELVVSHKRVYSNKLEFYNPLNLIIDNKMRDLAEYIKCNFFYDRLDYYELNYYFETVTLSKKDCVYLIARLLFPTYYFDIYDEIINKNYDEMKIIPIIDKVYEYEKLLYKIYEYILYKKKVQIEPIEWLIKNYS